MTNYNPPTDAIAFALKLAGFERLSAEIPGFEHADLDTVEGILSESASFFSEAVAPTLRDGDKIGAKHIGDGQVTTPPSYHDAYGKLVESGWLTVQWPEEFGGGGFPFSVNYAMQEVMDSANMAFSLLSINTFGAIDALLQFGSDELKEAYIPKLVSGEWAGTMNLTEPQAGTDLGALTTKAVDNGDGTYAITGQKIFITWGEHDLVENIAHLVLARIPGSPEGTKGISLFLVPKFLPGGQRNALECISIEEKLGLHGSPTSTMQFDGATGWLVGEVNAGLKAMFVMMNDARQTVGIQGLGLSELAHQQSVDYANTRVQGRTALGDTTIVGHPDVRRMLATQKSQIAAVRYLLNLNAVNIDLAHHHPDDAVRRQAEERVALLTPICKTYGSELGTELTSLNIQVHGGMGFIEETGAAQLWRDSRITSIYEGTTGVQAVDLVVRKVAQRDGAVVRELIDEMQQVATATGGATGTALAAAFDTLADATTWVLTADRADALAGSVAYLKLWWRATAAWLLAKAALTEGAPADAAALRDFFVAAMLPEAQSLAAQTKSGAAVLRGLSF